MAYTSDEEAPHLRECKRLAVNIASLYCKDADSIILEAEKIYQWLISV